jgi:hypothetical protein
MRLPDTPSSVHVVLPSDTTQSGAGGVSVRYCMMSTVGREYPSRNFEVNPVGLVNTRSLLVKERSRTP